MIKNLLLSLPIFLFLSHAVLAQEQKQHVHIRLIPESTALGKGGAVMVLIEETIEPGWHTYWTNPGDSGAAPRITWTLPEGFTTEDIIWPTPHKIALEGLVSYGYEGKAMLGQTLIAPSSLPAGKLTITADIEILVCKDICIPEMHHGSVTFNDHTATPEDNSAAVDDFYKTVPMSTEWSGTYAKEGDDLVVRIDNPIPETVDGAKLDSFSLMPVEWGMVKNAAATRAEIPASDKLILRQAHDDRDLSKLGAVPVVVTFTRKDGLSIAHGMSLKPATAAAESPPAVKKNAFARDNLTIVQAIAFALIGGLILNLMPCVFPVLSIKALSLIKLREKGWGAAAGSGIAYMAGVLASFAAIGGMLLSVRLAGGDTGWGFQLQNPAIVLGLCYLLFVIGLNLSGLFDIRASFSGIGSALATRSGWSGSFFTGVLAALVATPCTAPFMAGALGFALVQPPVIAMAVFLALGFGLALPYLLLAMVPGLTALLPRPGLWMVKFRELLAFPVYASAAWLVWVLTMQAGPDGLLQALTGLIAIAFALWLLMHKPMQKTRRAFIIGLAVLAFIIAAMPFVETGWQRQTGSAPLPQTATAYTPQALETLLEGDRPVFVYMTASWCITCKVNERIAIHTTAAQDLFARRNIAVLEGDWTTMNKDITAFLKTYGRNGVPLYVFFGAPVNGVRPAPVVLPQILTPGTLNTTMGK